MAVKLESQSPEARKGKRERENVELVEPSTNTNLLAPNSIV
jgi:hypothetical protein